MKKVLYLIALLIVLSGMALFVMKKEQAVEKGYLTADRNFQIKNMDEVTKIVIKQPKLQPIIFTKKGKGWLLNEKYDVDPDVFINIQTVLERVSLSYVPPKQSVSHIMESIKNNGIQVDIYTQANKPERIYYIGSDTKDGSGTNMIMGGYTQPYVMQLPGLIGGLRSRFEQPAQNYRDKTLFKFNPSDIKTIKIEYVKDNLSSFEITNGSLPTIKPLINLPDNPTGTPNEANLKYYINQFERIGTEGIVNNVPEKDSLIANAPNSILTITTKDNNQHVYKFYSYEHYIDGEKDPVTQKEIYAINRQYIYTPNDNTLYTAQMRVIRRIFLAYKDFFVQPNTSN